MKIIPFCDLEKIDFVINEISSIRQVPTYRSLNLSSRKCNGFLLIEQGECHYIWDTGEARLKPGALIYLPLGSNHRMTVTSENISFHRINFIITDMADMKKVIFTKGPWLVTDCAEKYIIDLIHELTNIYFQTENTLRKISLLSNILFELKKSLGSVGRSRIAQAVEYINRHYCENIKCEDLAKLCNFSPAQMYRLFNAELGKSPIQYKNHLRIERARSLLSDGECTVSEIASMLGFNSIYYFSRIFKEFTGLSPTDYMKNKENKK